MSKPLAPVNHVLVSHALCPYVQRAAIVLGEKDVAFTREVVDLADKPGWFREISPLGKVPLLKVGDDVLFESAVIVEYLDETTAPRMLPEEPIARAKQRGWIEFASATLDAIGGFYNAADAETFAAKASVLRQRFEWLESALEDVPWFAGAEFGLVDAAWAPVFRYFDVFDGIADFGILTDLEKTDAWRTRHAARPTVQSAVSPDYPDLLRDFLRRRNSYISALMA